MTISAEVQKLQPDALVTMFILDTTPIGGDTIFRFTPKQAETGDVSFGGNIYTAIDIEATGFAWDGRGSFPRPKLRVANIGGIVSSAIVGYGDLVGSRFTRLRTFAMHLDSGSTPDASSRFPDEIYVVDQLTKHTKVYLEWQLTSNIDQLGVMLPRRQCLRDTCTHRYRLWDSVSGAFDYTTTTCPYTGSAMFKEDGTTTLVGSEDKCNKLLDGCRLRFGENGVLPTRAFPGIAKTRN
jgi:lambda family phage minor tail protein L